MCPLQRNSEIFALLSLAYIGVLCVLGFENVFRVLVGRSSRVMMSLGCLFESRLSKCKTFRISLVVFTAPVRFIFTDSFSFSSSFQC